MIEFQKTDVINEFRTKLWRDFNLVLKLNYQIVSALKEEEKKTSEFQMTSCLQLFQIYFKFLQSNVFSLCNKSQIQVISFNSSIRM